MKTKKNGIRGDWDGAWKSSLSVLFPWFLAMFFKHVYRDIDWSRGFVLLDKELRKIAPDAVVGPRTVDLLFKVWLRSGEEQWVLIHIEIQSQRDFTFPKRLFRYNRRLEELYHRPVVTFAILADDEPRWRPGPYVYGKWGCGGEFHYPAVKLLDYAGRVDELEKNDNPFAVVVLAHLKARETSGDRARRREWKVRLLKGLYQRGWKREDVRQLLTTIDWFLKLPPEDNQLVREEIEADEQEKQMPYITSFEQIAVKKAKAQGLMLGEKRGKKLGRAGGLRDGISFALKLKFGRADKRLVALVRRIDDVEKLERVLASVETATTIDDVRQVCTA
jgi:hypothetical protein